MNHSIWVYGRPEQQAIKHFIVFCRHALILGVMDCAQIPAGEKPPHQKAIHQDRKKITSFIPHSSRMWMWCQLPGPTCQMWACHNCSVSNLILPVGNEDCWVILWVSACACGVSVCTHMQTFTRYMNTLTFSVHQKCFQDRRKGVFIWNAHLHVFASFWMKFNIQDEHFTFRISSQWFLFP